MLTALSLISSSLRLIGALEAGETPSLDESADALGVFQDMVDSWNADSLAIFTIDSQDFPFNLGQQSYTMGTGGDFDVPRPASITGISAILLQDPGNPIEQPMTMYSVDEWQNQIPVKTVDSSFPQICYDDGGFPLRTLNFWPIPRYQQNSVRIYSWTALASPAAYSTPIAFPPGYQEAFRYNLAVRFAPEYNAVLRPEVAQMAIELLGRVRTKNASLTDLRSDLLATIPGYNYRADLFGLPY